MQEGKLLKSLCTCYFGAEMDEDESNHPSNRGSPEGSVRGGGLPGSRNDSAAMNMSDRTVVQTLGDTVRSPLHMAIGVFLCH